MIATGVTRDLQGHRTLRTGMATVRRLNGTDISVTDGGDVTTVGGEDTGVIRDSHWHDT